MPCHSSRANVNAFLRTGLIDEKPTGRSRWGTMFSSSLWLAPCVSRNLGGARWVGVATAAAPTRQTCFVLLGIDGVLLEQRASMTDEVRGACPQGRVSQTRGTWGPLYPFPSHPTSHTPECLPQTMDPRFEASLALFS
jgi:hypothetical protein